MCIRDRNEIAVYSKSKGAFVVEGKVVRDELFQTVARAVLRAIREPSEGMVAAGGNVQWWESIGDDGETIETRLYPDDVPRVWQAMIDKALGEE